MTAFAEAQPPDSELNAEREGESERDRRLRLEDAWIAAQVGRGISDTFVKSMNFGMNVLSIAEFHYASPNAPLNYPKRLFRVDGIEI